MAYSDWMPEFQEIYGNLPVSELESYDREYAEFLFEEGFMRYTGEGQPGDIQWARDELFAMLGEEWEDYFDWEDWRKAMGYELCHELAKKRWPVIGSYPGCGPLPLVKRTGKSTTGECEITGKRTGTALTKPTTCDTVPTLRRC